MASVTDPTGQEADPYGGGRPVVLASEETPRGSVVLRRRYAADAGEVIELITNGTFVMDTLETSTERLLARSALAAVGWPPPVRTDVGGSVPPAQDLAPERRLAPARLHVVAAGLGLGFTLAEVLADSRVGQVDVIEIEPAVVAWVGAGLIPGTTHVLDDERVRTTVVDVRRWLPDLTDASIDVLLLDVDNGPDFLVHRANTEVYEREFLTTVKRVLRPGGTVAVWSASRSSALRRRLEQTFGGCDEVRQSVSREGRDLDYFVYVASTQQQSER